MRVVTIVLGALGLVGLSAFTSVGCSSSSTATTATSTSTSTSGTASTGSGSASTSSGSSGSCPAATGKPGTGSGSDCTPTSTCVTEDQDCLALVDNTGLTSFGLRMSYISIATPQVLGSGLVATIVQGAIEPSMPDCNIGGTGLFTWLLEFDTTAGTLKTGGAKPVTCPTAGYQFENDTLMNGGTAVPIAPITLMAKPSSTGAFAATTGMDVTVPIYLTADATTYVLLPIKQAVINMGTLSTNNNCIGSYNAAGLQPSMSCAASDTDPLYKTGGSLEGYITLEDADKVIITQLKESLCFLLAGSPSGAPTDSSGNQLCPRTGGTISYEPPAADGGWCASTNAAGAPGGCDDSVHLTAAFAAAAVKITN